MNITKTLFSTAAALTIALTGIAVEAEAGPKLQLQQGKSNVATPQLEMQQGNYKLFKPQPQLLPPVPPQQPSIPQPPNLGPNGSPKLYIQPPVNPGCQQVLLGIYGQPLFGYGLQVTSVLPNTIASKVGLEPGDVITQANGRLIRNRFDLRQAMTNVGRHVNLTVSDIRGSGLVHVTYDRWTGHVASSVGPTYPGPVNSPGPMLYQQN